MKRILAALTFVISLFVLTGFASACTQGVDCPAPVVPVLDECVPGSCGGGYVDSLSKGNVFANTKLDEDKLSAKACTDLEMITVAGAPAGVDNSSSIQNTVVRDAFAERISADGLSGFQFKEALVANQKSTAVDGGFEAGLIKAETTVASDMSGHAWDRSDSKGVEAGLNQAMNVAVMACETDGTVTDVSEEVIANSFQKIAGDGFSVAQQAYTAGKINIKSN